MALRRSLPRPVALCVLAVLVPGAVAQYSNFPAYDSSQVAAEAGFAPEAAVLQTSLSGFVLTAGSGATLRDINGGQMCVDASGFVPPGYELKGRVDLATCAAISREQPNVVGFRWGRETFDMQAYRQYSAAGLAPNTPVKLVDLFPGTANYTCMVYLVAEDGSQGDFQDTQLAREYGFRSSLSRRLKGTHAQGHGGGGDEDEALKKPSASKGDQGLAVCQQRWTLLQFFHVRAHEFWFCYVPEARVSKCLEERHTFVYVQGMAFISSIVAFFAVLAFIMQKQGGLIWALLWTSRVLLNMMLGMAAVGLLLYWGLDGEQVRFSIVATLLAIGMFNVLFLPFCFLEFCPFPCVFYLMVLTLSPTVLAEVMSYYPTLPLLLNHRPMIIGTVSFAVEVFKTVLLGDVAMLKADVPSVMKTQHTPGYIRMYPGAA